MLLLLTYNLVALAKLSHSHDSLHIGMLTYFLYV